MITTLYPTCPRCRQGQMLPREIHNYHDKVEIVYVCPRCNYELKIIHEKRLLKDYRATL